MLPLVIAGLPLGAMYGLAALGLVVVHRTTRNIDLSLGAVATAAAFAFHRLTVESAVAAPLAVLAALAVAALIGFGSASATRRLGPGRPVASAVASLAVAGFVLAACTAAFGDQTRFVPPFWPDVRWRVGGAVLSGHQLLVLAAAALIVGTGSLVLRRTATGLAWRATADDRTGAAVVGLPVGRIETSASVAAALLAGMAGILLAPLLFLDPVQLTVFFLVKPLAAAVATGLRSLPGAFAAGLAVGVLESLSVRVQFIPGLGEAVPLAIVAVALLRAEPRSREGVGPVLDRAPSRLPGRGRVWPAAVVTTVLLLVAPHQTPYQATITQLVGITTLLAATHVVQTGWTGQLSLAQPALAGIGAITAARLASGAGLPLPITLVAGTVAGGLAAAAVGAVTAGRVVGLRFAALTLAVSGACAGTLFLWPPFAGSAADRTLPPAALGPIDLDGPRYTWVVIGTCAVAFAALRRLARSRWGAAMIATREHDRAAITLGVPIARARLLAFTVTGALAGLAGAIAAHQLRTVAPEQFHPLTALPVLSAAVVGGVESLWGAAAGATFLALAPELVRHTVDPAATGFLAPAALLVCVLLRPGGMASLAPRRPPRLRPAPPSSQVVPSRADPEALVVTDLRVRYGRFVAVDGVSFAVAPGEMVVLIGPNGAGKTTVLDAISGFVRPAGGRVEVGRRDLRSRPVTTRAAAGVIRTFQAGGLFPRLTVRDNLEVTRRWHRLRPPDAEMLERAGLAPYIDQPAAALPHGIARVAEIVRAVGLEPALLLLDEPAAGLRRPESSALIALVRQAAGSAAVLLVEHDQHVVALADRAVVLHEGRVLADGPTAEVLRHPDVVAAYLGTPAEAGVVR